MKKILVTLGSLFLLYRSIELVRSIYFSQTGAFGLPESMILAILINLFITGVFALPGFAFPTSHLLPAPFYTNVKPATVRKWYDLTGVEFFRKVLLLFFWGKEKNRKKYFDGTRSGLENFIFQSHQSEFGHLIPFIVISLVTVFLLLKGFWVMAISTTFINVIGNAYPILLQRYHRIRIDRIIKKGAGNK